MSIFSLFPQLWLYRRSFLLVCLPARSNAGHKEFAPSLDFIHVSGEIKGMEWVGQRMKKGKFMVSLLHYYHLQIHLCTHYHHRHHPVRRGRKLAQIQSPSSSFWGLLFLKGGALRTFFLWNNAFSFSCISYLNLVSRKPNSSHAGYGR